MSKILSSIDSRFNVLRYGADRTGVANSAQAFIDAHGEADAASPKGVVTMPTGKYRWDSTVDALVPMFGLGGNSYKEGMGASIIVPTMTDGSPALRARALQGWHFRNFAIMASNATPNPNLDTGYNLLNATGIQLGLPPAIIKNITRITSSVLRFETKHPHALRVGDVLRFDNLTSMTQLNSTGSTTPNDVGGPFTVTQVANNNLYFRVATAVDNTSWGSFSGSGICYPDDLGVATACSRGVMENVTVANMRVNFQIAGWLNRLVGLKSINGALGFDGGYLNTCLLDLVCENSYQGAQFMGCNKTIVSRYEDEGGLANDGDLRAATTIDYSQFMRFLMYSTEGGRNANTPWLEAGLVSYCQDIHILGGLLAAATGGAYSAAIGNVDGYRLPHCVSGHSTTASSRPYCGTASFSSGTTVTVNIPTQADTSYRVNLTPTSDPSGRLYVSAKTTTTFTVTNTTSGSSSFDWSIERA